MIAPAKQPAPQWDYASAATPSKYKKVYFRSEKKLVDGAFHSPSAGETGEKKNLAKALGQPAGGNVQRRSSRGESRVAAAGGGRARFRAVRPSARIPFPKIQFAAPAEGAAVGAKLARRETFAPLGAPPGRARRQTSSAAGRLLASALMMAQAGRRARAPSSRAATSLRVH